MREPYDNNRQNGPREEQPERPQNGYPHSPYGQPEQDPYAYAQRGPRPDDYSPYNQVQSPYKPKRKRGSAGKVIAIVVAVVLVLGSITGGCIYGVKLLADRILPRISGTDVPRVLEQEELQIGGGVRDTEIPYTTVKINSNSGSAAAVLDVSQVVEDTMPAMVAIDVVVTQTVQDPFSGFGGFFGFGGGGGSYQQDVPGSGSGIIIGQNDTELLIVTNRHVVGAAKSIAVQFTDGESVTAYLKGADSDSDLAVIGVLLEDMKQETLDSIKIAVMGSSDELKLGIPVIAIGNALGYGQSVTVGYISALKREVKLTDGTMTLLQTDAAINPGNSGGALLNMKGEVVGINSAKFADTDVEGMGYAIPISDAIPKINELMNSVAVPDSKKPYLGIRGQAVPESFRSYFGWPEGVYVQEITPNSPAVLSGLRVGDIIVGFKGETITTMTQLQEAIAACEIGERADFTVMRPKNSGNDYTLEKVELSAILIARGDVEKAAEE